MAPMRRRTKRARTIVPRLIKRRTIRIMASVTTSQMPLGIGSTTRRTLDRFRISSNPRVMGGKPTLRGTRVTASTIAGLLATAHSEGEVLALYPYLEADDIRAVERWTKEKEAARGGAATGGGGRSDG